MDEELQHKVAERVKNTDGDKLIRAANRMDTAYDEFWKARGRLRGVKSDSYGFWDSASGRSFRAHAETVEEAVGEVSGALTLMSTKLRAHGELANSTSDALGRLARATYRGEPMSGSDSDVEGMLQTFLDSEQELTGDLWSYGALAPGGIPLPQPPPRPPGNWKTFLFGDSYPGGWYWMGANGQPSGGHSYLGDYEGPDEFDPDNPIYGYDEWGNLVPAYQAGMPVPMEVQEANVAGPLIRLLGKIAGKGARAAGRAAPSGARAISSSPDDLANLIRGSYGWRPSHIDRHIREWYRLADDAPVPPWMKDEFLDMVVTAGTRQGKVFQWSLRGQSGTQPTYSVLRYHNGRWMVSQYYANGARAGEFATAFEVQGRQLARMLQQAGIR